MVATKQSRSRKAAIISISTAMDAKSMELKHTIQLIQVLDEEIKEIEASVKKIMDESHTTIMTNPGISYRTGAIILSEIGDFSCFDNSDKILAYAGLSPSTYQSGQLDSSHSRMENAVQDTCGMYCLMPLR